MKYTVHYRKLNSNVTLCAAFDELLAAEAFAAFLKETEAVTDIEFDELVDGSFDSETGYFSGVCRVVTS